MTSLADMSGTIAITVIICFTLILIAILEKNDKKK